MVFFSCNNCGEASKKNQVERHLYQCRNATFSCMDCQLIFTNETYKGHVKCISENKKYGGKNYVEKENKGEVKQNAWVEQVCRAIDAVEDRKIKDLLQSVAGFGNIPRKEAKFINFLMNSRRLGDRNLALRAWQAIAAEAEKMRQEAIKKQEETEKAHREKKEAANAAKATTAEVAEKAENDSAEPANQQSFKWKKAIKRKLKDNGGEMKMKKLRKEMLNEYSEFGGQSDGFDEIFAEKLEKCGAVRVDGKMVHLE